MAAAATTTSLFLRTPLFRSISFNIKPNTFHLKASTVSFSLYNFPYFCLEHLRWLLFFLHLLFLNWSPDSLVFDRI